MWLPDYDSAGGGQPLTLPASNGEGGGNPLTLWNENGGGGRPTTIGRELRATLIEGAGLNASVVQIGPRTFAL